MTDRDYTVTAQTQERAQGPTGTLIDVIEVAWQGPNGITGREIIPMTEFTPQNVDARIRAALATRLQVAGLGGQS